MTFNRKPREVFKQWFAALRAFAQVFAKSYWLIGEHSQLSGSPTGQEKV